MRETPAAVALFGGSGFIGTALAAELDAARARVRVIPAPRLQWPSDRPLRPDAEIADAAGDVVDSLARRLDGVDVVVNAAGVARATAPSGPALYGANGLLPLVLARACAAAGVRRFIHLSSAAVQAEGTLDETDRYVAHTPYARSRILGERLLLRYDGVEAVIFRPTSVHGPDRSVTRALVRLARSPLSCVAGDGTAPTPQVLVEEVAGAVAHLATVDGPVPRIVLQPHNGMTTGLLLRLLGGREPRHLPWAATRAALRGLTAAGRRSARVAAYANRLDLLLFGRRQVRGWLADAGAAATARPPAWAELGARHRTEIRIAAGKAGA